MTKDNTWDKYTHGTMNWGERCGSSKLKLEDIPKIRALAGTMLQREIGEMFGVSDSTVGDILSGRTWAKACQAESEAA
jgi:hypothetical protein